MALDRMVWNPDPGWLPVCPPSATARLGPVSANAAVATTTTAPEARYNNKVRIGGSRTNATRMEVFLPSHVSRHPTRILAHVAPRHPRGAGRAWLDEHGCNRHRH